MSGERQPVHATLHARKVLAARLAVLRVFECGDCQLGKAPEQLEAVQVQEALFNQFQLPATGKIGGEAPTAERLDAFLATQAERRIDPEIRKAQRAGQAALADRLTDLSGRLRAFDCRKCAGPKGHVCNAHEEDDATVAAGGCCVAELRTIFEWAKAIAVTAYDTFAPGVAGPAAWTSAVEVHFETEGRETLRSLLDMPRIDACAEFAGTPSALETFVKLAFSPDHFDAAALQVCPYALTHELVAHAFLAAAGPASLRQPAEAEDGWAEGWMDAVAFVILSRAVAGMGAFRAHALPPWLDEAKVQARSGDFHKARYQDPKYRFARTLARDRAGFFTIYRRLRATSRADLVQEDVLLRACLLINGFGAPTKVTARLLSTPRLFGQGAAPLTDREAKILRALTDFLDHQDPGTLEVDLR